MITANFRLITKLHRFELLLAAILALAAAIAGVVVTARLSGVSVPLECAGNSLDSGSLGVGCLPSLDAFGRIYYEQGALVLASMAILPVALGLLGGVPIVGRELEGGTAPFAWSVAPSRTKWLLRQIVVVGLVLTIVVGLAALSSNALESTRRGVMQATPFENFGLFGAIVLARMFAAFTVGLFVGATTGRTLPAFIIGALVMLIGVGLAGGARDLWATSQPQVVVDDAGSGFDGQVVGLAWIDEAGGLVSYVDGISRAPGTEDDPDSWLWANGYRQVSLGITRQAAQTWAPIEVAGWVGVGFVLIGATAVVTSRRRPHSS